MKSKLTTGFNFFFVSLCTQARSGPRGISLVESHLCSWRLSQCVRIVTEQRAQRPHWLTDAQCASKRKEKKRLKKKTKLFVHSGDVKHTLPSGLPRPIPVRFLPWLNETAQRGETGSLITFITSICFFPVKDSSETEFLRNVKFYRASFWYECDADEKVIFI